MWRKLFYEGRWLSWKYKMGQDKAEMLMPRSAIRHMYIHLHTYAHLRVIQHELLTVKLGHCTSNTSGYGRCGAAVPGPSSASWCCPAANGVIHRRCHHFMFMFDICMYHLSSDPNEIRTEIERQQKRTTEILSIFALSSSSRWVIECG
jgi:hypothetical protein